MTKQPLFKAQAIGSFPKRKKGGSNRAEELFKLPVSLFITNITMPRDRWSPWYMWEIIYCKLESDSIFEILISF